MRRGEGLLPATLSASPPPSIATPQLARCAGTIIYRCDSRGKSLPVTRGMARGLLSRAGAHGAGDRAHLLLPTAGTLNGTMKCHQSREHGLQPAFAEVERGLIASAAEGRFSQLYGSLSASLLQPPFGGSFPATQEALEQQPQQLPSPGEAEGTAATFLLTHPISASSLPSGSRGFAR